MSDWKMKRRVLWYAMLLSVGAVFLDYTTGPYISFPILFVLPVAIVSWYRHWHLGMVFAGVLSAIRLWFAWLWAPLLPQTITESCINAAIRFVVLATLAYFTTKHRELQQQVRVLSGILPICSFCKKIRDQHGNWQVLESYIRRHSEAEFSHGLCPDCARTHYKKYLDPAD